MQAGKILPVFRQFFATSKPASTGKDPGSRQEQGQGSEREATKEETARAAQILNESDEFVKNELVATVVQERERFVILVTDRAGNALRSISGNGVRQILLLTSTPDSPRQGRILDRRI